MLTKDQLKGIDDLVYKLRELSPNSLLINKVSAFENLHEYDAVLFYQTMCKDHRVTLPHTCNSGFNKKARRDHFDEVPDELAWHTRTLTCAKGSCRFKEIIFDYFQNKKVA